MIMAFAPTNYNEDDGIVLDDIYLVHVRRKDGGTCLDDFVARYINGISAVVEPPKPVMESKVEAPVVPVGPDNQTAPGPDAKPESPILPPA